LLERFDVGDITEHLAKYLVILSVAKDLLFASIGTQAIPQSLS
jgi:hypothetical protein